MIETRAKGIPLFQFTAFQASGLFHGVFTRQGGVSPAPWDSLNLGGTVGDNPENVNENLTRLLSASGFSANQLVQVKQIHSSTVVVATQAADVLAEGDAIITDRKRLFLLMRFADCVPILFYDAAHQAIGIAHAGWKGTLKGVVSEVVRAMHVNFNTDPEQLKVGIGPSIGPDHYQIGDDVIAMTEQAFPDDYEAILNQEAQGVRLDLWKANQIHLLKMGVKEIEIAGICTGCDLSRWYSHRLEKGTTGRFAAGIGLL
jgi:YfiH family protein